MTDANKRKSIEATLPLIFDAIDTNNDGGIGSDEFANYFGSFGLDKAVAQQTFNAMDANGDGELSREGLISLKINKRLTG